MRRIARLDRSIVLVRARSTAQTSSPYLCAPCRHQASSFSTSTVRTARENSKVAFTEKLRRKIWGTDQPPGQADPYGGRSVFDQTKKRADEAELQERRELQTPTAVDLSTYEPASTWDGLERVGGFGGWWKQNWDPDHQFQGFLPSQTVKDAEEVTAALHRAIVEVLALQQTGIPLSEISKAGPGVDLTHAVHIQLSPSGVTLQFTGDASLEQVVQSLTPAINETTVVETPTESEQDVDADRSVDDPLHPGSTPAAIEETSEKGSPTESEEDVAADRSVEDPLHPASKDIPHERVPTESEEDVVADRSPDDPLTGTVAHMSYGNLVSSWDPAWLQVSLADPEVKFAVMKRTMQLTGVRIPDSVIRSANTAQALLTHLTTPPKPRKLADALAENGDLLALPNVSIFPRRITPIDKERSIGRWKIIEEELQRRGLPVTGNS